LEAIDEAIQKCAPQVRPKRQTPTPSPDALIEGLVTLAGKRAGSGVLLIVDELGKFLEHASGHGGDIFFFQQLAEAANRASGRLVVVGILHQAFEQYASRLGAESRDEWAKVQGRFVDIPLIAGVDEVLALTAKAVEAKIPHKQSLQTARAVAQTISANRAIAVPDLADRLDSCWPLHPVTASLLGPVSRRRFGQNERSTFGFLTSAEPGGFKEFLESTEAVAAAYYSPAAYWDYLRINLEPAILSSPDGHRWAQGADSVLKAEARGSNVHSALMKSIALIDLFRNGSGLLATEDLLHTCFRNISREDLGVALRDLAKWSVASFRRHSGSWAIFDGSDFDIDSAVSCSAFQLCRQSSLNVPTTRQGLYAGLLFPWRQLSRSRTCNQICLSRTELRAR
jgi:hypothetical protein